MGDSIQAQVEKCWRPPSGSGAERSPIVLIEVDLDRTGVVQGLEVKDKARYKSARLFEAIADSAMRAFRAPACLPIHVPPAPYRVWRHLTPRFDVRDIPWKSRAALSR